MQLLLPPNIQRELSMHLARGGTQEIGGVLMGQNVSPNVFRVIEITCQYHGGSFAYFLRSIVDIVAPLRRFFKKTNNKYREFNYLGEWHSHPSFALMPSATDFDSMQCLVEDTSVGANFAVLLLVKLTESEQLGANTILFLPQLSPVVVETIFE